MEANFREDLTLEEFASYTGRSLATFKRDFAKISPLTPEKWLLEKRLDYAHRLLTEDHRKISDVYLEAGFRNRSHFSTAFQEKIRRNASGSGAGARIGVFLTLKYFLLDTDRF